MKWGWRTLGVHLAYALYKGSLAVWYGSAWLGATAAYYLTLSLARFFLLRDRGKDGWRKYRFCGGFLLVVTAAVGAVSFYTVWEGRAVTYPWHLIYAAAAYTFYNLTATLIWLGHCRKGEDPAESAGKLLSLAAAMVALFSLQAAMLAAFGDGGAWQRQMNALTGGVVFLAVGAMAVHMLRKGNKEFRLSKNRRD